MSHAIPKSFLKLPNQKFLAAMAPLLLALSVTSIAQSKPRARDLGVPFDGTPGPNNAITDVKGVEVGHATLISGNGKLVVGNGPVRTGVTAIHPRGRASNDAVFAAWFTLNGNGEMTGTTWVEDSGFLNGPVMITNTHSVGVVRDAVIAWKVTGGRSPSSQKPGTAISTTSTDSTSIPKTPSTRSTPPTPAPSKKATWAVAPA
jgi:hypothetical protein